MRLGRSLAPDVAALFVSKLGPYWGRSDVDAWDVERDARLYNGELPGVFHPPCNRWSVLAASVQAKAKGKVGYRIGDDNGCFASALANIRRVGGVLEHPAYTFAWAAFDLLKPNPVGWTRNLLRPNEYTCSVFQCHYGHEAAKNTWLLYVGDVPPPELNWNPAPPGLAVISVDSSSGEKWGDRKRIKGRRASRTPPEFADLLISLARRRGTAATSPAAAPDVGA